MRCGSRFRFTLGSLAAVGLALTCSALLARQFAAHYCLRYDPQRRICLPWRVYLGEVSLHGAIERGDLIAFHFTNVAGVPLKQGASLGKIVAGIPGDRVEVTKGSVFVNGNYWGDLDLLPLLRRSAASYERRELVPPDHYFVLGSGPLSFDSRYWGFITAEQVIGHLDVLF